MSNYENILIEKRANTWNAAKALLDNASAEKRELTAAENESLDRMNHDMDSLRSQIDKLVELRNSNKSIESALAELNTGTTQRSAVKNFDTEIRSFLTGQAGRELVLSSEQRALSNTTTSAGGATVPTGFYDQLIVAMQPVAALVGLSTVITTDSGESMTLPVITNNGAAGLTASGADLSTNSTDPTFAARTLSSFKYAQLVSVPNELIADTGVDLTGYLAKQTGRNIALKFGADLVAGNGSNKPTGLITSTTLGQTGGTGSTGAFLMDDLISLFYSVNSYYRNTPSAVWLMSSPAAAAARKLKDSYGQYLWNASLIAGQPDTLLGKPVVTDENIPVPALGAKSVVFGDLSTFLTRIVGQVKFESSVDFQFGSDVTTFRATLRGDGVLADQSGAVKHFAGGAS